MYRKTLAFLCLLLAIIPAFAQDLDSDQMSMLETISGALENTITQDSFIAETTAHHEQVITSPTADGDTVINQTVDEFATRVFESNDEGWNASVVLEQDILSASEAFELEIGQVIETILLDEVIFVRYSDMTPDYMQSSYPDEWMELSEAQEEPTYYGLLSLTDNYFYGLLEPDKAIMPFAISGFNENTVVAVEMLESDSEDLEVYRVTMNPDVFLNTHFLSKVLGVFDFDAMGLSGEDVQLKIGEDTEIVYTLSVNVNGNLINKVESDTLFDFEFDASAFGLEGIMSFELDTISRTVLADFDETNEITGPKTN